MKTLHLSSPGASLAYSRPAHPRHRFRNAVLLTAAAAVLLSSCRHDPEPHLDHAKKGVPITPDGTVRLIDVQKGEVPGGLAWADSKISCLFRIKGRGDTVFSFISSMPSDVLINDARGNPIILHPESEAKWIPKPVATIASKDFAFGDRGITLLNGDNGVKVVLEKISKWDRCAMLTFSKGGEIRKIRGYPGVAMLNFGDVTYYVLSLIHI